MKKMRLAAAVLLVVAVAACSDRKEDAVLTSPVDGGVNALTTGPVQELINGLFPQPGLRKAATAQLTNVARDLEKGQTADAQQKAAALSAFTTFHLNDGVLLDPNGSAAPTTEEAVGELNCELHNLVTPGTGNDIGDCESFAQDAGDVLENGGAVGVIGPTGGVLLTPNGQEGISVPAGATLIPRVFTINPIAASVEQSGPLVEPRCIVECDPIDQYPLFGHFAVTPAEPIGTPDFLIPVTVGLCHLDAGDGGFAPPTLAVEQRLRIGHNLETESESVELEILEKTAANFLTGCGALNSGNLEVVPPVFIGLVDRALIELASVARPLVSAVLPDFAYAATIGTCCLGGLATKLSPFGAVDPGVLLTAQDPGLEGEISSPGQITPVEMIFTNHTADSVIVYWLGFSGERVEYTRLGPGLTYRQETWVGHHWLIASEANEGLAIYTAIAELGFAEFFGPVGSGPTPPPPPIFVD